LREERGRHPSPTGGGQGEEKRVCRLGWARAAHRLVQAISWLTCNTFLSPLFDVQNLDELDHAGIRFFGSGIARHNVHEQLVAWLDAIRNHPG
jgi:hypothetical protein